MNAAACFSENDVLDFVEGRLDGDRLGDAERHLSSCAECARLVAAASVSMSGGAAAGAPSSAPAPLEEGSRLGRYVIQRTLGEGAMARVYAAHDPELDRTVALKVLHARLATHDLEARLRREAKAMARLSHSEVITVFDAGRHDKQLFIAMELVDGETLRQWLAQKPRPWREIVAVFVRAGRGLAEAHAAGLVHRDFKPDNVLIGKDGRVRVTDFGLAHASADPVAPSDESGAPDDAHPDRSLTRTGMVVGTPAYMAPEQLRGEPADPRSDVYAFCVALYEALYGERPFSGATIVELQAAKREGRVRSAPAGARVPARLRRAIVAGLAARPDERYASMNDALAAIERASRRSRVPWIAAAAVAAAFAVAIAAKPGAGRAVVAASASIAPAAPTCSPSACTASHGGVPHACRPRDGACVPIASEDCTPSFEPGDLRADDTVWIGAMFPLTGPGAETHGKMSAEGAVFARKEIADATRALENANASKHVRRIALVSCDDVANPERAARHLVEDVGVPAVLGFGSGQKMVDLAGSLLIPNRVLGVATLSQNPLVTRVPQPPELPRMTWRTTFSAHDVARSIAKLIEVTLAPRVARTTDDTRVTLARIDAATGLWFGEELYARLVFNGKSAKDNGDAYQEVTMPAQPPIAKELRALADGIVATRPSIVVLAGATGVTTPLIVETEKRWPANRPRPFYAVDDTSIATLADFMGTNADRRHRIFGVTSVSNELPNARFVNRYNAAHDRKVSRFFNPSSSYDAFYLVAYGAFALGARSIDGPSLARAFERLTPAGRDVEVGPLALFDGIATLDGGGRIDLRGAASVLDLDPSSGESPIDFEFICAGLDASGRAAGDVESGLVYRASSKTIEGQLHCP